MLSVALCGTGSPPSSWLLIHSLQLGGVFSAIQIGLPAGFAALIIGLQPILIAAVVGPLLGERVSPRQWVGFILGFGGAALVLGERYGLSAGPAGLAAPALAVCGLIGGAAARAHHGRHRRTRRIAGGRLGQGLSRAQRRPPTPGTAVSADRLPHRQ